MRWGLTMDLDEKLYILGIASDARVAAWDFLIWRLLVSSCFPPSLLSFCIFGSSLLLATTTRKEAPQHLHKAPSGKRTRWLARCPGSSCRRFLRLPC
jgi:sugar lactone lactonase YvrE